MNQQAVIQSHDQKSRRRGSFRVWLLIGATGLLAALTPRVAASDSGLAQLQQAAEAGNADAMNKLGFAYQHGQGVPQDLSQALSWFKKGADADNAGAMTNLGFMYEHGLGVAQDYQQAMSWYIKATHKGFGPAMYCVGYLYEEGGGVPKDAAKALQWYNVGAKVGDGPSMAAVGMFYYQGKVVKQDYKEAAECFRKAAEAGSSDGMTDLAVCYRKGAGVPQDSAKALEWYRKGAAAGNPTAQQWLAKNAGGGGTPMPPATVQEGASGNAAMGNLGQRYVDTAHGCSYLPPKGWEKKSAANGMTKFASEDGPNVSVLSQPFPGALREFADANITGVKNAFPEAEVLTDDSFATAQGPAALRIKFKNKYKNIELVQIMYFFEGKEGQKILMTASMASNAADANEPAFDACASSLTLLQ